nr:immunoglobulin heavy chain junction region [Mus musculus]
CARCDYPAWFAYW